MTDNDAIFTTRTVVKNRSIFYRTHTDRWDRLPEKVPGHHRWVVTSTFSLTDHQCRNGETGSKATLDGGNLLAISQPGCIDCAQTWEAVNGRRCEAEAFNPTEFDAKIDA